jgi:GTP cyclohydrolase II
MKIGDTFKVDTYRIKQYEEQRVVDVVTISEIPKPKARLVLVHSPKLQADVLIPRSELKEM